VWNAATVLVCALDLLGRSAVSFPPIALVEERPPDASSRADAFVGPADRTIYVITSAPAFQSIQRTRDRCGERNTLMKLASVLVHEEWHVQHGPDERGAYLAQLVALLFLGAHPGHPVYLEVQRSMQAVLGREPKSPRPVPATRQTLADRSFGGEAEQAEPQPVKFDGLFWPSAP